jgi:hypothetical protein
LNSLSYKKGTICMWSDPVTLKESGPVAFLLVMHLCNVNVEMILHFGIW